MVSSRAAAMLMMLGQLAAGASGHDVRLVLQHPPASGETVWLKIKVGPIGRSELHVTTPQGRGLGTISTYGVKAGTAAGVYMLPLPLDVISDGHLTVRLTLGNGEQGRPATRKEVPEIELSLQPASR